MALEAEQYITQLLEYEGKSTDEPEARAEMRSRIIVTACERLISCNHHARGTRITQLPDGRWMEGATVVADVRAFAFSSYYNCVFRPPTLEMALHPDQSLGLLGSNEPLPPEPNGIVRRAVLDPTLEERAAPFMEPPGSH